MRFRQDSRDKEYSPPCTFNLWFCWRNGSSALEAVMFSPIPRKGKREKWDGRYRDQVEISDG